MTDHHCWIIRADHGQFTSYLAPHGWTASRPMCLRFMSYYDAAKALVAATDSSPSFDSIRVVCLKTKGKP